MGRSVFEEVSGGRQEPATPRAGADGEAGARRAIRIWLLILAHLVAVMVLVGGLTRLTDSGLSITEWAPVMGALPPLSAADWQEAFAAYKTTTEFKLVNSAMTLDEFKVIYWWEWGHRQLGRLIGLVWLAGFVWFLARRMIPAGWTLRLLVPGLLGGMQGAIGWWMVSSGLERGMVDVASYRLALHLGLAFVIFALLLWLAWRIMLTAPEALQARRRREAGLPVFASVVIAAVFLQLLSGALVAGIDAGRYYPSWPMMTADSFLPPDPFGPLPASGRLFGFLDWPGLQGLTLWVERPAWASFFENPGLAQFVHRILGYLVFVLGVLFWLRARGSGLAQIRKIALVVPLVMLGQIVLGIITVVNAAPLHWAILHQAGALVLLAVLMRARFSACYPAAQKLG